MALLSKLFGGGDRKRPTVKPPASLMRELFLGFLDWVPISTKGDFQTGYLEAKASPYGWMLGSLLVPLDKSSQVTNPAITMCLDGTTASYWVKNQHILRQLLKTAASCGPKITGLRMLHDLDNEDLLYQFLKDAYVIVRETLGPQASLFIEYRMGYYPTNDMVQKIVKANQAVQNCLVLIFPTFSGAVTDASREINTQSRELLDWTRNRVPFRIHFTGPAFATHELRIEDEGRSLFHCHVGFVNIMVAHLLARDNPKVSHRDVGPILKEAKLAAFRFTDVGLDYRGRMIPLTELTLIRSQILGGALIGDTFQATAKALAESNWLGDLKPPE